MNENNAGQIRLDYNNVMKQVQNLEDFSNQLYDIADHSFSDILQGISSNWKGGNANAYLSKGSEALSEMKETAVRLKNIASHVRTVAENIHRAEMENIETANTRIYQIGE